MKNLILYFAIAIICASCGSTDSLKISSLDQNMKLTKVKLGTGTVQNPVAQTELYVYDLKKGASGFIEIKDNKIQIDLIDTSTKPDTIYTGMNLNLSDSERYNLPYEFEHGGLFEKLRNANLNPPFTTTYLESKDFENGFFIGEKFKYSQTSENFQTITIPFKLRPGIDTFSYQLTTGVNVGFSYVFKKIKKTYEPVSINKTSRLIGYRENEFEYGFAPFIGLTTVGLKGSNTRGAVATDKTVFGTSLGILLSGGINKFDVGIAFGIDHAFGKNSGDWIYQDKPWFGLVLGIDLVK